MAPKKPETEQGTRPPEDDDVSWVHFPFPQETASPSVLEYFPEHAALIACIIAEWSQIETKLALWLTLRLDANNEIILPMVYRLETSRARLEVLSEGLTRLVGTHPDVAPKLESILNQAANKLKLRNKYAHAHFAFHPQTMGLAITPKLKMDSVILPLHDLQYQLKGMKELTHTLVLIVAAELQMPLLGPSGFGDVPEHPLGKHAVRLHRKRQEQPPPSPGSPEVTPATGESDPKAEEEAP